ncbi:MAG: family 20 glycosylhydrolase [Acidobacteria bacterium]|nr:family 20 glycosylhydrolase [Acidobacteriota bacterium]
MTLAALSMQPAHASLMPQPARLSPGEGKLAINQSFRVALSGYQEPRIHAATQRLLDRLARQTGMPLVTELERDPGRATLVLHCDRAGEPVQSPAEDESYRLKVTATGARLDAPTPVGLLRGIETFLQLVEVDRDGFTASAVEIQDQPRFPWRGLLLDVARHWMPLPVLKRNLDAMAAVKLNVLHLHLSDDQGFRIESVKFPKLHQRGSDGSYFTQQQIRELIAYARDRGIRVVPEFDMPGHATSWLVGYPELASLPGPYQIERAWGIFDACLDPTREEVFEFLDVFIGEMAALFPDGYFHTGGDEVSGKWWETDTRIEVFRRERTLGGHQDLQAYFTRRVQAIVSKHGKTMVGWDEVLRPDLPKDIVVQSWRGQKSLVEAVRQGYPSILSHGYYLDHIRPAAFHYRVDPLENEAAALTAGQKSRILGAEACMWAEYVTAENVDSRIWPRAAAIAERLWSPQEVRDVGSMYRRLAAVSRRLEWLGLTHRSSYSLLLQRLAGDSPVGPLQVLADILEPLNLGGRAKARHYTSETPLNRLVDAVRPESDTAREFAESVDRLLAAPAESNARDRIRPRLELWRDNHLRLSPTLRRSFLLQEVTPLSEDLSAISAAGLEALNHLASGQRLSPAWLEGRKDLLKRAAQPRAELQIQVVAPIRKLIEAATRKF